MTIALHGVLGYGAVSASRVPMFLCIFPCADQTLHRVRVLARAVWYPRTSEAHISRKRILCRLCAILFAV